MKNKIAAFGSFVAPIVLVLGGVGYGTRQAMQQTNVRTAAQSVREQRDPTPGPGRTDDVALIGDSITEQSELALRQSFGSAFRVSIRARGGYRIEDMEPYGIELSTNKPEQVIIELGTNDVLTAWPLDKSIESLQRMIDRFPAQACLHIVNVNENIAAERGPEAAAQAVALNVELRRIAEARQATIIDWAAAVRDDIAAGSPKGGLLTDTIHPNSQGKHKLGTLFREALDSCQPAPG